MKEENNINILELLKVISKEIKETRKNSSDHIQELEQINKSIIKISDMCKNLKVNDNIHKNNEFNEYERIILKNLESRISILEENKETYKLN
jgi:hypothetical protein